MYSTTRDRLTQVDREFIAGTVGETPKEREALRTLASDRETVTELLHRRSLFDRALTTPPVFHRISPHLFFYVFIYQALDARHLANDDVVDYVAGICVEFGSNEALWRPAHHKEGKMVYFVDLLQFLNDVDRHQQYYLRRYIGNVSLFFTGFFPDFIFHRSRKEGAPPIEYYQNLGRSQFETAAGESTTYDGDAAPVLSTLAERFVEVRSAMNVYNDAYLALNRGRTVEIVERQAATLDEDNFRRSLTL